MTIDWFILAPVAFFAGMVDAVVGGGGLIQIPVLLSSFPQTAIPTLFGTNKVSSIAGTGAALWRYARAVRIPWRLVLPATAAALVGAWLGAAVVAWLSREAMRPLVVVMMLAVAIYTFLRKDLGQTETHEPRPGDAWRGALFGLVIGLYDGFFGPGTGSARAVQQPAVVRADGARRSRSYGQGGVLRCGDPLDHDGELRRGYEPRDIVPADCPPLPFAEYCALPLRQRLRCLLRFLRQVH